MMNFMGWTLAQWAEAAVYHKRFGEMPEPDARGAKVVRVIWLTNRADQPGGRRLLEVAYELDFAWASRMMENAVRAAHESIFQRPT